VATHFFGDYFRGLRNHVVDALKVANLVLASARELRAIIVACRFAAIY
jgi:hypothetical protein